MKKILGSPVPVLILALLLPVFLPGQVRKVTEQAIREKNLSFTEALYYDKIPGETRVICSLCPRECSIGDGDFGDCRVRANVKGKLYFLVHSRPVTMNIDPIEKKPLFHYMPRSRSLSVATVGCVLHCLNCQNWDISQQNPFDMQEVSVVPPKNLLDLCDKYGSKIISFTYAEPVAFFDYALDTAKLARSRGVKTVLVSSAYINPEPLAELCRYVDAATIDIKGMTEGFYRRFNSAKLAPVLAAVKVMKKSGIWLELSYLVIPDENDSDEDFRKIAEWVRDEIGPETPFHLLRFFPQYKLLSKPPTPLITLKRGYDLARKAGLKYVYVGNSPDPETQDTFCPKCGKKLVDRQGFDVSSFHIVNGKCEYCGQRINGVWN